MTQERINPLTSLAGILKALEICSTDIPCSECPYYEFNESVAGCRNCLMMDTRAVLVMMANRLKEKTNAENK